MKCARWIIVDEIDIFVLLYSLEFYSTDNNDENLLQTWIEVKEWWVSSLQSWSSWLSEVCKSGTIQNDDVALFL